MHIAESHPISTHSIWQVYWKKPKKLNSNLLTATRPLQFSARWGNRRETICIRNSQNLDSDLSDSKVLPLLTRVFSPSYRRASPTGLKNRKWKMNAFLVPSHSLHPDACDLGGVLAGVEGPSSHQSRSHVWLCPTNVMLKQNALMKIL